MYDPQTSRRLGLRPSRGSWGKLLSMPPDIPALGASPTPGKPGKPGKLLVSMHNRVYCSRANSCLFSGGASPAAKLAGARLPAAKHYVPPAGERYLPALGASPTPGRHFLQRACLAALRAPNPHRHPEQRRGLREAAPINERAKPKN